MTKRNGGYHYENQMGHYHRTRVLQQRRRGDRRTKFPSCWTFPYYDKAIIDENGGVHQLATEIVVHHDERPISYTDVGGYQYGGLWYTEDPSLMLPVGMRVAEAQFEVIRKAANRGPLCGGRAAAPTTPWRTGTTCSMCSSGPAWSSGSSGPWSCSSWWKGDARKLIRKTDKIRANYYRYYTQQIWGDPANFELIIDAGKLGTDAAAYA